MSPNHWVVPGQKKNSVKNRSGVKGPGQVGGKMVVVMVLGEMVLWVLVHIGPNSF